MSSGEHLVLVRLDDRDQWVAVEREGRVYVYDPKTQHFHFHDALSSDWFDPGREADFVTLDEDAARELVKAGQLGRFDRRTAVKQLVEAHSTTEGAIPLKDVLP